MRGTAALCRQHLGHSFKVLWMVQGCRRVPADGTAHLLAARGVSVVDAKDILSRPYPRNDPVDILPHTPNIRGEPRGWTARRTRKELELQHEEPCYTFNNHFSPILGLSQSQVLTNTLVRPSLPPPVLATVSPTTSEEDKRVQEAILHAHLLDSTQLKLPRVLDVINRPGIRLPREWGIPLSKTNKSLTYQLLLLLDHASGAVGRDRQLVEDTICRVTLRHTERLIQFHHRAAFILSSPQPLPVVAGPEEVEHTGQEDLPDLHPVSPFVSVKHPTHSYQTQDLYGVASPSLHPHTIFIHNNSPRLRHKEEGFMASTLLYAFSHAAAYASLTGKSEVELNKRPVVLQVVHCNRNQYHLGVLQLNTLDLARPDIKNIFWTQPWQLLFSSCSYEAAAPTLKGYNPEIFSHLKGLYLQGGMTPGGEKDKGEKEIVSGEKAIVGG